MKYAVSLGKVSGIKISIHWTFLILIGWIVLVNLRASNSAAEIAWSVLFILTVFVCVTLHELGHALTAQRYGIQTRSITLLPIGGLAQLESIPEKPKEELAIALAGPAVNIVLALLLWPFVTLTTNAEAIKSLTTIGSGNFLIALMTVNLWLALFNLLPAFPMDGGRVLRALLAFRLGHVKATRVAATVGQTLAIGFVFVGFLYNPFLVFIGLFIFIGAQAEAAYSESRSILQGYTVQDVLMHEVPTIDRKATLHEAAQLLLNGQNKNFVVMEEDKPVGTLSRDGIIKGLQQYPAGTTVSEVKDGALEYFQENTPLEEAWTRMRMQKKSLVLVVTPEGKLEGVLDEDNLTEFILIQNAHRSHV